MYGGTLVLASLQASLAAYDELDVTCLKETEASTEALCALRPDVVIFDVEAVHPAFHFVLAETLPDLVVVGIDSDQNRVLVWSGQQLRELSTRDLVEVIGRFFPNIP